MVQMADNGLGTTLLPAIAVKAGLLRGTGLITRPFVSDNPAREIRLVWRKGTGRRHEFLVLAEELARRAVQNSSKKAGARLQAL
ncbi:MAG: LysR substrate-binding domain-containing protein [Rhodomicrobium sp.]